MGWNKTWYKVVGECACITFSFDFDKNATTNIELYKVLVKILQDINELAHG